VRVMVAAAGFFYSRFKLGLFTRLAHVDLIH
jgi:hypothetical protein